MDLLTKLGGSGDPQAISLCEASLSNKQVSDPEEFWFLKGWFLLLQSRFSEAATAFQEAARHRSSYPDYYFHQAYALLLEGGQKFAPQRNEETLALWKKALDVADRVMLIQPDVPFGHYLKSTIHHNFVTRRNREFEAEHFDACLRHARESIKVDRQSAFGYAIAGSARFVKAHYQFMEGKDCASILDKAISDLDRAIELSPRSIFARSTLGQAYALKATLEIRSKGDPAPWIDKALRESRHAFSIARTVKSFRAIAEARLVQIRAMDASEIWSLTVIQEGVADLRDIIRRVPKVANFHRELGILLTASARARSEENGDPMPDVHGALQAFEEELKLIPGDPLTHFERARLYRWLSGWRKRKNLDPFSELEHAIREYGVAIKVFPKSRFSFFERGEQYLLRAEWTKKKGEETDKDLRAALKDFNRAIENHPTHGLTFLYHGITLWKLDRKEEARKSLTRASQLDPILMNHKRNAIWKEKIPPGMGK